ncbi:unnamed protein product [Discula destructiva]
MSGQSSSLGNDLVKQTYLRFTIDDHMKDEGAGFVFGNDPDSYDVYVYAVSRIPKRLFAIIINMEIGALILKNLTRYGIKIKSNSLGKKKLTIQRVLIPEDYVEVMLHDFDIHFSVTLHRYNAELYERLWADFCRRFARGMPTLAVLNMRSYQSSKRQPKDTYILGREVGRGQFGTVYRAIHYQTGAAYAIKVFHKHDERQL